MPTGFIRPVASRQAALACRASLAILAIAALSLCGEPRAASTAPLEVSATVTPAACTPVLSNGGMANYGMMNASMLRSGQATALAVLSMNLTISCDVAARFAMRLIDNRAGSVVPGIVASGAGDSTLGDEYNFGLGASSGRNVGGYVIRFVGSSFTADYQPVQLLMSNDGSTWNPSANGLGSKRLQVSWGSASDNSVQAYKTVAGSLSVQAFINKTESLTLNQEIVLDGSATLELVYL